MFKCCTLCYTYVCHNCECEFYYPFKMNSDSATVDSTVYCPKCNSNDCGIGW